MVLKTAILPEQRGVNRGLWKEDHRYETSASEEQNLSRRYLSNRAIKPGQSQCHPQVAHVSRPGEDPPNVMTTHEGNRPMLGLKCYCRTLDYKVSSSWQKEHKQPSPSRLSCEQSGPLLVHYDTLAVLKNPTHNPECQQNRTED